MNDNSVKFKELADRPGHLIRRLHQIHVALFLEECSEFNLTPVQFGVLNVLVDRAPRDQVTIATMIGVDRNTAADVIRRLEKRGYIERPQNLTDKRTKLAKISETGFQLVQHVRPGMIRAQCRLTDGLSEADYEMFMTLSKKIIDANDHSSRAPWNPEKDQQNRDKKILSQVK
jgi:DNA-binding MarR family transcriptional regulator